MSARRVRRQSTTTEDAAGGGGGGGWTPLPPPVDGKGWPVMIGNKTLKHVDNWAQATRENGIARWLAASLLGDGT